MSGYDFWIKLGQSFGWDKAPGTRYSLKQGKDKDIIIESTGAGHGIGLCQWGASSLARNGKNYKEILEYYFPGCEVR
jgi:stage II sporulation protein D